VATIVLDPNDDPLEAGLLLILVSEIYIRVTVNMAAIGGTTEASAWMQGGREDSGGSGR